MEFVYMITYVLATFSTVEKAIMELIMIQKKTMKLFPTITLNFSELHNVYSISYS